jgi:hypothetical protein
MVGTGDNASRTGEVSRNGALHQRPVHPSSLPLIGQEQCGLASGVVLNHAELANNASAPATMASAANYKCDLETAIVHANIVCGASGGDLGLQDGRHAAAALVWLG